MSKSLVAVVRYESPLESVQKAVELSNGLENLTSSSRVFIKPNIVFWAKAVQFPKWGVITTSRVVEDMVVLLKEHGVDDIIIGEGIVTMIPGDRDTPVHAFNSLGYEKLKNRYGVKYLNIFERPFEKVEIEPGLTLNYNKDILYSDFIVDLPVMKAHNQTVVSLGIKNLKGIIDISSRKKCHSTDTVKDLHYHVSRLSDKLPPIFTLIDGIYSLERGPGFDGKMRRSNILVASSDILSADMVGARLLGYQPSDIPYLVHAAKNRSRPTDLSDIKISGEEIDNLVSYHEYDFKYAENENCTLPVPLAKQGIEGIFYRKYDSTMCTYCSAINGLVLSAIRLAWKGDPWDDVEILTGKIMKPTKGKKTILIGKCMCQANSEDSNLKQVIKVKGCPPKPKDILLALHKA
ncbi:MAG: DUF362 domain-containing protein, partial [Desulfobacterales bacterium]|nr:DUF362 domain-containing protein [Desulfobacterales bacterium]